MSQLCACAPALKAVLWKPIKDLTGKLSDRLSNNLKTTTGQGSVSSDRPFYNDAHHTSEKHRATEGIALVDLDSAERGTRIPTESYGEFKAEKKATPRSYDRSDSSSMVRSWPRSPSISRSLSLRGSPHPQPAPGPPQRLEILQETSFSVSAGSWPEAEEIRGREREKEKELPEVPESERDERPRHRPLIPTKWRSDGRRVESGEI